MVDVAKSNRVVRDFFNLIGLFVNMSGSSVKQVDSLWQSQHDRIGECLESGVIASGRGNHQETKLARPGNIRWVSHYITLLRFNTASKCV